MTAPSPVAAGLREIFARFSKADAAKVLPRDLTAYIIGCLEDLGEVPAPEAQLNKKTQSDWLRPGADVRRCQPLKVMSDKIARPIPSVVGTPRLQ
jgi:hypothetical protein